MDSAPQVGRLLLVDDDAMLRMLAAESLRHAGFEVSEADCGEAGLRACQENEFDFDLLLLDVMMPGIDGYTVCATLRRDPRNKWLPIVMLTGLDDSDSIERAYAVGATDFVTKPINWTLLSHRVRYALRTSRAIAEVTRSQASLAQAQRQARMGNWQWSLSDARFSCSDELQRIFGDLELAGPGTPERFLGRVQATDKEAVDIARQALLRDGTAYRLSYAMQSQDGKLIEVLEQAQAVRNAAGRIVRIEGVTQDISERMQAKRRIQHLTMHDGLTGLANRQFFTELVKVELARARRTQRSCALLHLDLDHFKSINDAFGDTAGDRLLCEIAERLKSSVRASDLLALHPPMRPAETVARIDGDAFTVLLIDVCFANHAALVAERLLEAISRPLLFDGRELVLTAGIGIALFPRDADSVETLGRHAEQALYVAKRAGPAHCRFFDEDMNTAASAKLQMENELRHAIGNGELRLHFQPKVDAGSGRMSGAEALVRWQHPRLGLLAPGQFIALAEECGLIVALGDWVLAAAARHLKRWSAAGLDPVRISVNLASPSFLQDDIAEKLADAVHRTGVSPQQVVLELTESLLMVDAERTIVRLHNLRDRGFSLSLDDFGTGYSSLSYLQRFPIDELKIDRAFVTNVARGGKDAAIALSIIELGRQFGMRVVAEGIETREQADFLLAHGCAIQQGFLFSRPLALERFEAVLAAGGRFEGRQTPASAADRAETTL
ncbi:MAG: Bacteriophytochrome cph2 [Candidatus Accumulibacter appositus]|uniref:Bacteriophytochrome cph2 n=1 Tax=Candidatus Accumulibacter appositus TaxID=1454003 RepID=A0A011NB67_9PROT|nr:EAL domain-containing response regulator [Accumulibacter sp.]EXI79878.1 MAG: Bacteriophytochrome cph2 [Candidatus Accumulibacter appositus]HRF05442.1 EAL domain-containing protein [Accumulibacter sp.]